eukprot:1055266-Amphidinium_carterae.1
MALLCMPTSDPNDVFNHIRYHVHSIIGGIANRSNCALLSDFLGGCLNATHMNLTNPGPYACNGLEHMVSRTGIK